MKHKPAIADIMENSIHLINESYNQPLHLNTIARQNFMSPATYSRYFFEFTQCNFSDYINQLRVEHAKNDLINTSLSLTDIALDNGFSNSSVFSKIFKNYTKQSPSEFRKKFRLPPKTTKPDNRTVIVKVSGQLAYPYEKPWLYAINGGEAQLFVRADYQKQLLQLKELLSIKYVRMWNLFSEDIFPCGFTDLKRLDYNHMDSIFDFLVCHHIKPWINLTRGSEAFLNDIGSAPFMAPDAGNTLPEDQLTSFFENLFRHWTLRYGSDVVSKWIFECWFDDMNLSMENMDRYINIIRTIKTLLSQIAPGAKLGILGSAILSMYSEVDGLMQHWPKDLVPDFISIVSFPYERYENNTPSKMRQVNIARLSIQKMTEILTKYGMDTIPVYITQWNMTVSPRNAINDSCVTAAALLNNMEETLDDPWPILYHHASDISTAQQDTLPLIFGGTGLITRSTLLKPVCWSLIFLKKMPDYCVSHGPGYIITTDKIGRFDLLLFNSGPLPDAYYQKNEYEITTGFVLHELSAGDTITYQVDIRTEYSAYRQSITRLSPGDTDLLGHLQRFGDIVEPSADELQYLRSTVRPELTIKKVTSDNYHIQLCPCLKPYEIYYISLLPLG